MSDRSRLRLFVLRVLVLSLLLTLFSRLWYLQVLAGETYQRAAADNQLRDIITPAPRGQVLDDFGRALVRNRTALVVSVDRLKLMRQKDGGRQVLQRLSQVLKVPYDELHQRIQLCGGGVKKPCWNGSPYQPIPLTDRANTRMALQILEQKELFPGVTAELEAVRDYPEPSGALASHALGYLGPITDAELAKLPKDQRDARRRDLVGRTGLEKIYDTYLRGQAGVRQVSVDHLGAVTGLVAETPPKPGDHLVTGIDANVQAALEKALVGAVDRAHKVQSGGGPADFAAGVVMDAQTGHVVALASYPSYQPDVFVGGVSQKQYDALQKAKGYPLLDKTWMSAAPPGSTFKLISTTGLVHDGIASLDGYYDCTPSYSIGGRVFRNFEGESFGAIDLHTTIVKSCDTVYYQLAHRDWLRDDALVRAKKQPVEGVQAMARAFGLGEKTGIDLPDETTGHIGDRRNQKLRWEELKDDYCKGARNPKFDAYRRAVDAEFCTDGWRFNPGDQLNEDIGQGTVLLSPLQLATAYSALVNGGTVFSPRVGKAIVSPSGQVVKSLDAPVRGHLPVSKQVLSYVQNAMYDVPISGTATQAFLGWPQDKVRVGGKTGTAEVGANAEYENAWFASFAGRAGQKARFVTVIMVSKGGQGGVVAAPAVREVWDTVFGVDGKKAAFPNGVPPSTLPHIQPDGTIRPASYDGNGGSPAAPVQVAAGPAALPAERRSGAG